MHILSARSLRHSILWLESRPTASFTGVFLLLILIQFVSRQALAEPSFDCSESKTEDEKAICGSDLLSVLDLQISELFEGAKSRVGPDFANRIAMKALKKRRKCHSDKICIEIVQREAIDELLAVGSNSTLNFRSKVVLSPKVSEEFEKLRVVRGRCHMDYCLFIKLIAVTPVITTETGTLFSVWSTSQSVKAPPNPDTYPDYDLIETPAIFSPAPNEILFYCSTVKPLLVTWSSGDIAAYKLPIGNSKLVMGATVTDHLFYWAVCHRAFLEEGDLYSSKLEAISRKIGYPVFNEDDLVEEPELQNLSNLSALHDYIGIDTRDQ